MECSVKKIQNFKATYKFIEIVSKNEKHALETMTDDSMTNDLYFHLCGPY